MKRRILIGSGAALVFVAASAAATTVEKNGTSFVSCELPVSLAGTQVDIAGTSQAPCEFRTVYRTEYRIAGAFTFFSGGKTDLVSLPAKEMFAFLSSGETEFPAERSLVCANHMADFLKNNKDMLLDSANRNNSEKVALNCNEEARF